jgi:hypothetical protein
MLLGNYLIAETQAFAVDIGIILTGIPFYIWRQTWLRRHPGTPSRLA